MEQSQNDIANPNNMQAGHTSIFNSKKDKQNAPKIPVTGLFNMTFCPISGMVFEILSLRPTEIWQP